MDTQHALEEYRLSLQTVLDAKKDQTARNKLGQFATPTLLALDILRHAKTFLPAKGGIAFFDPAIGTGAFFSAALRSFPKRKIIKAHGFELDSVFAKACREIWKDSLLKVEISDFTKAPAPTEEERFNLLICNPPYVRHHHLLFEEKIRLQRLAKDITGLRFSGLMGLYGYFLILSHQWMAENGVAGWLIPSEFMDVNYGRQIKHYLLERVTLLQIHRFNPALAQFDDALVSSVALWFRKTKPPENHKVLFTYGDSLGNPEYSGFVEAKDLQVEKKWTRYSSAPSRSERGEIALGDLFTIKRGLATGSNEFFILNRDDIESKRLPKECFKPILPSPRYLSENEVLADRSGNPVLDKKLFVLDTSLPEDEIGRKYPNLWEYLQEGIKRKVNEQYICSHRQPWYAQEHRSPCLFVCTYLGRDKTKRGKPFRFILNRSKALVANVYLNLYPKPFLSRAIKDNPALSVKIWEALNGIKPEAMFSEGRVYGGGLRKLEPKELANVPADAIASLLPFPVKPHAKQSVLFAD
ncbi:MAG: N-6 DNA methylase [Nitrospinae bacterium]|nr:N-6 DNA methylase [Nitrospinota bacterium]